MCQYCTTYPFSYPSYGYPYGGYGGLSYGLPFGYGYGGYGGYGSGYGFGGLGYGGYGAYGYPSPPPPPVFAAAPYPARGEYRVGNCLMICQ